LRWNAIAEKGKQYAIYFIDDMLSDISINIPTGKYKVLWMHPLSGKYGKSVSVKSKNDKLNLKVPVHKEDLALKVIAK